MRRGHVLSYGHLPRVFAHSFVFVQYSYIKGHCCVTNYVIDLPVSQIYEYHIFELRKYELDRKKIIGVRDTTYLIHISAVQIYDIHMFILSSLPFTGLFRTDEMTNSQLAC